MNLIAESLGQLTLGAAQTFEGVTAFALLAEGADAPSEYLTVEEALAAESLLIGEVDEAGDVPTLIAENTGERPVLILEGDELIGARQNRAPNVSILLPALSKTPIPVSCVEAGRWSYSRPDFVASRYKQLYRTRRSRTEEVGFCLRTSGRRDSDQYQVWSEISQTACRIGVHSPSQAMHDVYEQEEAALDGFAEAVEPLPNQVGVLFAFGSEIAGLELYDSPATLCKQLPKLLRSYGLETLANDQATGNAPADPSAAARFLEEVARLPAREYAAVGDGVELRLEGERIVGGALHAQGRLVHLSAFPREGGAQ